MYMWNLSVFLKVNIVDDDFSVGDLNSYAILMMIIVVLACMKGVGVYVDEYVKMFVFGDDYLMNDW
ncbi:transmembrane protein, putative [Medicago truncatula]|uniref:Transmembrane protein, putative n=1 Tax=Medicago truncatula TaxID=3880 RepID=A2Q3R7_MEDTR|nr:hypothetical protein MtrDRAFT_AC155888g14v2 [Medicago truncatula]AES77515.1 transmembrane protein, putative [Medicago truncatula]